MIKFKFLSYSFFLHFLIFFFIWIISRSFLSFNSSNFIEIDLNLDNIGELNQKSYTQLNNVKKSNIKIKKYNTKVKHNSHILTQKFFAKNNKIKPTIKQKTKMTKKNQEYQVVSKKQPQNLERKSSQSQNQNGNKQEIKKEKLPLKEINSSLPSNGSANNSELSGIKGNGSNTRKVDKAKGGIKKKFNLRQQFLVKNLGVIARIFQRNLKYPYIARKMGWEGKVVVSFLLTKEGKVTNIKIEKSSGYKILDDNVIKTLKKCEKYFPHPPIDIKIKLPIVYKLY